ncbi:MAG: hypothetical protein KDK34_02800 [Leptospiraceae bacterium]|nr:hypothetical protein [Leptospiraceae bacterium]
MNTLEARVKKLESRRFLTTEQKLRTMSDEQLEDLLTASLRKLAPAEWAVVSEEVSPETRALYEELRGTGEET